jgi:hypothetical protein
MKIPFLANLDCPYYESLIFRIQAFYLTIMEKGLSYMYNNRTFSSKILSMPIAMTGFQKICRRSLSSSTLIMRYKESAMNNRTAFKTIVGFIDINALQS